MVSRKLNSISAYNSMGKLPSFHWGSSKSLKLTCHLMYHILILEQFIWAPKARVLGVEHGRSTRDHYAFVVSLRR